MQLDADACYAAITARDDRFDGRFFVGVRSTGIYCRPICPAVTPKRKNCVFLPCAAAAQEAGFRPCLRCRPEAAPGTPAWRGTSATVTRALRLIEHGALDRQTVGQLANHLGITERHLRRLFAEHVGASPQSVANTRRLLFAKKLIDETTLSMTDIAYSCGFTSIRRFNDAFKNTYRQSPTILREKGRGGAQGRGRAQDRRGEAETASCDIRLRLSYRPPFAWEQLTSFLAPRAIPGVESVDEDRHGGVYRRTLRVAGTRGLLAVTNDAARQQLEAHVQLPSSVALSEVHQRLRRLFDLTAEPAIITEQLGRHAPLRALVRRLPGLRVPGAFDGFELAVRAILGQQVSVRGASTLAGRVSERFGERLTVVAEAATGEAEAEQRWLVFPTPEVLAEADLSDIGLPRKRAEAISALAAAVARGDIALDPHADIRETMARLLELPGIGDWTTNYIAMRALGHPDVFLASDLILRRALAKHGKPPSVAAASEISKDWSPWRSYAALHLWTATSRAIRAAPE